MTRPLDQVTRIAKALAHPGRLRILSMLHGGELCVCQLTAALKLAPSTVSAHLAELKRAGLIVEEKRAKFVFYALSAEPAAKAWQRGAIADLRDDPAIEADRDLIARIRAVPVDEFAASGKGAGLLPTHPAPVSGSARGGRPSPGRKKRQGDRTGAGQGSRAARS